jgi:hypothetical protein
VAEQRVGLVRRSPLAAYPEHRAEFELVTDVRLGAVTISSWSPRVDWVGLYHFGLAPVPLDVALDAPPSPSQLQ